MPIAAALVFAPGMMLAFLPFPIVGMDGQANFGALFLLAMDMPAIAFGVADNTRRGASGGNSQGARAEKRGECNSAQRVHSEILSSVAVPPNG
jgi:uncharacterized membrane protein